MIGLNLLPDIKKEFIKAQRTRNVVISFSIIAMIAAVGVTVVLALAVYVGQNAMITLQKGDIQKKQATLVAKPEIEKYLTIQSQLDTLKLLHDDDHKVIYSRLFDVLTKLNPSAPYSVSLSDVKVDSQQKSITMQGFVSDYKSLSVFQTTLEKAKFSYTVNDKQNDVALFSAVTLKTWALSTTNGKSRVSFEFDVVYAPEVFQPSTTINQVEVPKLTVSDAQDNAPNQLFNTEGTQ